MRPFCLAYRNLILVWSIFHPAVMGYSDPLKRLLLNWQAHLECRLRWHLTVRYTLRIGWMKSVSNGALLFYISVIIKQIHDKTWLSYILVMASLCKIFILVLTSAELWFLPRLPLVTMNDRVSRLVKTGPNITRRRMQYDHDWGRLQVSGELKIDTP